MQIHYLILAPVVLMLSVAQGFSQLGLSTYGSIPGLTHYDSKKYTVQAREVDSDGLALTNYSYSHTYYLESVAKSGADRMSHSHWTTFSFSPNENSRKVEVELTLKTGNISTYEFRPTHVSNIVKSGNTLTFQIESNKYTALIVNNDIRNPMFVFCDPAETNVPNKNADDVFVVHQGSTSLENPLTIRDIGNKKIVYFETGEHWINETDKFAYTPQNSNQAFFICKNDGSRINSNKIEQIYIPGGCIVHGNIRATKAENLMVNGRGIIEGENTYGYATGDYLSSQILSSAINMSAYRDKTDSRPSSMNQLVDGITSILPRKYNFQLGTGAVIRNTKCFAYHQTTDGIGVEKNSIASNNFIKVNDDALKLYQDNCIFVDNYIWHQMNGSCMQLGWGKEEGDDILVQNTYLLHDDMFQAGYFNEGFWANQSIICWLKHRSDFDASRNNIVIDGINSNNMPAVDVVRLLAIAMDGNMGGSGAGNLDMTLKNVHLGQENPKTPSYVGNADGHTCKLNIINSQKNGVCIVADSIEARGNTSGISITSDNCAGDWFTIYTQAGRGGRIEPGTMAVQKDSNKVFTIIPDKNWEITDVIVDSVSVGAVNQYEFTAVDREHSIEVIFSNPTSIESTVPENNVMVYPNPANDVIHIKSVLGNTIEQVEVFSLQGHLVYKRIYKGPKVNIKTSELFLKGLFVLKITSGNFVDLRNIVVM